MRRAAVQRHARAVVRLANEPEPVRWRRSRSFGLHHAGRLAGAVQLPSESATFFTWDPLLQRAPNRAWRRWGADRLVRTVLRVLDEFARAHPGAPRVGVGDLSRPRGGDFGPRHVSHQSGLDVDVYYPRLDGAERAPNHPREIDLPLAQDLVDRFVRARRGPRLRRPANGAARQPADRATARAPRQSPARSAAVAAVVSRPMLDVGDRLPGRARVRRATRADRAPRSRRRRPRALRLLPLRLLRHLNERARAPA